ncbi:MAG: hypothetical protein KGS61_15200, partial [Verrucomicrobia bacterium]|nr:hypothetical protein [Verrucomicrobiota bacterium]
MKRSHPIPTVDLRPRPLLQGVYLFVCLATVGVGTTQPAFGQMLDDFLVAKGQIFTQTSSAAPTPLASGAAVFDAEAPGFGGLSFVTGGSVSIPGGGSKPLAYVSAGGIFQFTDSADTVASLDGAYPAGLYTVTLNSTLVPGLTGAINLPADVFPPVPAVENYTDAQAVNTTNGFNLAYQPFTGAASPDDALLVIYEGTTVVISNVLSLTGTNFYIPARTLSAGKTYDARLRFRHLTVTQSGLLPAAAGFFSETRFSLTTLAAINPNTQPPTLTSFDPAVGGALPGTVGGLALKFSKAMDQGRIAIQWTATLNGSPIELNAGEFWYQWGDPETLLCAYAPLAGGWPLGLVVSWTLNPATNSTSNFADTDGNLLASGTYSGSFVTYGGPWSCVAAVTNAVEAPGFYLTRRLNYVQTSDTTVFADPRIPAQFQAYYKDPGMNITPIVVVVVPVPGS